MRYPRQWWLAAAVLGLLVALFSLSACQSSSTNAIAAPSGTTGDITISVDRTTYGVSQPVGVTITNGSNTDYYAATGRSACTFLQLEEYVASKKAWVPVVGCQTAQQAQTLLIPGKPHNHNNTFTETFTLAPGNAPANANNWETGLYRVALTYSSDSNLSKGMQTAYSPGYYVK